MRIDTKVPFHCKPLKVIQDVDVTLMVRLSISKKSDEISKQILSEKHPDVTNWKTINFSNLETDSKCNKIIRGFVRKQYKATSTKKYIYHCASCSKDPELYGSSYFMISQLSDGTHKGCGCSTTTKWTKYQFIVRIIRKAKQNGHLFCGFVGEFKGIYTKIKLYSGCEHGTWTSTIIDTYLRQDVNCPSCLDYTTLAKKDDSKHISDFMKTGVFHPAAKFSRSTRMTSSGHRNYWDYTCPICVNDEYVRANVGPSVFSFYIGQLKNGIAACRCSSHYHWTQSEREYQIRKYFHQKPKLEFIGWQDGTYTNINSQVVFKCSEHGIHTTGFVNLQNGSGCPGCSVTGYNCSDEGYFYIHKVSSLISKKIFYKFGITKNLKQRLQQYSGNIMKTEEFKAFYSLDGKSIYELERYIKMQSGIEIGVIPKELYQSGFTETIHEHDLILVLNIVDEFMNQHKCGMHIEVKY